MIDPILYLLICISLRLIAIGITMHMVMYGYGFEANPLMNYLFNKFGIKKTIIVSSIVFLPITLHMTFCATFIYQMIFMAILILDAGIDIYSEYKLGKK